LRQAHPDDSERRRGNHTGQVWGFVHAMKPGDWVVMPLKSKPAIAIGEITKEFAYDPKADPLYRCWRGVNWLNQEVPPTAFDKGLRYSFGAIQTLCQIQRNDAEKRIHKMAVNNWQAPQLPATSIEQTPTDADGIEEPIDLERLGRDEIAKLIIRKLKGH